MKFSREVEHGAIATIREAIAGKKITQEDSYNGEKTEYVIGEIVADRYDDEPCLIAACESDDGSKLQLLIRAGFLEI